MKTVKSFNVIMYELNTHKFEFYDVIPYLLCQYKKAKHKPKTFEEFKAFIKEEAMYRWWAKCEYEIILMDWPCKKVEEKWDIYDQVTMNLDIVTNLVMESI